MKKLVLYIPHGRKSDIRGIREMLKKEAHSLNLRYEERRSIEDYLMVYYEDDETSTFIYLENENDSLDNIRMMVRVLALIASSMGEEKTEEMIVET